MGSAELVTEIEAVRDTVAGWCDSDRAGWSAADRSAVVSALLETQERLAAAVLDATADWDANQAWAADGALSPVPWLRSQAGVGERDARRLVRSARVVARNDDLAKAMRAGDVSTGHVDALAAVVTAPRAALFDEHADVLLDAARTLSVDDLSAVARRWAAYADDQLNRGQPAQLHGRRGVWFARTGDLEELRALGDPIDLAVVRALLDRLEPPDATGTPGGPRTLAQRRYDALVALSERHLPEPGRRDPAHTVNVVIDDATLAGAFDPDGRCEIPGVGSVLPSSVQRVICGSWLSRVILGAKREVLELGREARLFSPAQQRAILIRDGGCVFANCDRPPSWCDVHHLDPFGAPTHGQTDLANGIAACRPHHTLIHQGWTPYQDEHHAWQLRPP